MMIESNNPRIKGDMRIIEILITKEEQALKNIGDPALLLGKFSIEDEELVVSDAIESGSDADAFSETLDSGEAEFDPFEALMAWMQHPGAVSCARRRYVSISLVRSAFVITMA